MNGWYRVVVVEDGKETSSKPYPTWVNANDDFEDLEKEHEDNPKVDVQLCVRES